MTVPEALADPHLRRFELRRHRVNAAGGTLSLVTPKSYWDVVGQIRGEFSHPYWADIWPASVGLARHLLKGPTLEGCHALDLGCGVGVAGIAAGRRGASVIFGDVDESALHFARFNADHNAVSDHREVRYDWDEDLPPEECNLLLLSDVAYDAVDTPGLYRQVQSVVERGGRALISDPWRDSASELFARLEREFDVELLEVHAHSGDERVPLRLTWVQGADW